MANVTLGRQVIRVGIIGFGGAGIAHLLNFRCVPGCVVTKVFDPKQAGLDRAAKLSPGLRLCTNLPDFWPDLDTVTVCSPDDSHANYIVEALDRGLHVICEKPLTNSLEGIREIKAARQRSGRTLAVLHQMRFVPLFQQMKLHIATGRLGRIGYMEGYYVHDLRKRAWTFDNWRGEGNATAMVYAGIHFLDLLRGFADEEIIEIQAAANNVMFPEYPESDLNIAILKFGSGMLGKVVTAIGAAGPQDHSVRVYGTDQTIDNNVVFNRDGRWVQTLHAPMLFQPEMVARAGLSRPREWVRQVRANLPPFLLHKIFCATRILARNPGNEYGAHYYPLRLYEHSLACVRAISTFVDAARTGSEPLCSVDESAKAVLVGLAGLESFRTGKSTRVMRLEEVVD